MQIKPLIITMGEPAGIGGELTLQAWQDRIAQNLPVFCTDSDIALKSRGASVLRSIISASTSISATAAVAQWTPKP